MRQFNETNLRMDTAEAILESYRLDIPNSEVDEALSYVSQFVYRGGGNAKLYYGYLPEQYADALVTLRDENSSYDLNAIVAQLCVDGDVSQPVTEYDNFVEFSIDNSFSMLDTLWEARQEAELDETKTLISTARDLIEDNRGDEVTMYVPEPVAEELSEVLD